MHALCSYHLQLCCLSSTEQYKHYDIPLKGEDRKRCYIVRESMFMILFMSFFWSFVKGNIFILYSSDDCYIFSRFLTTFFFCISCHHIWHHDWFLAKICKYSSKDNTLLPKINTGITISKKRYKILIFIMQYKM